MTSASEHAASFRFHGALNDFLPRREREKKLTYTFRGAPAIKDAIEAMGVPHPEVDVVLADEMPVPLQHPLHAHATVEVYPVGAGRDWPAGFSFEEQCPPPHRFVLDVHLGTLAKNMRMLGLDTCYQTDLSDATIARIAQEQERVVLTRDIGLLKHRTIRWGYWLRSQHTMEQLREVIARFNLWDSFAPFARCLACNVPVQEVGKEEVLEALPPKTRLYFEEFYRCPSCERVYWKGSHYERMQQHIENIRNSRG